MNKTTFIVWALAAVFISGVASGIYMCQGEPPEMYQAAMHISNWTNRTLDINLWVLGGSQYSHMNLTLAHGENVTITITFPEVTTCITFIHYVGEDINQVIPYEIEAGDWQSVVLISVPNQNLDPSKKEGYYRALGASLCILSGAYLLLEHIWSWGGTDVDDPLGHETYGMILVGAGYLLVARRNGRWLLG